MLKKCIKIISVFLCAVLIFQSLEVGIFATVEQPDETDGENEISCPCENCPEYECSCECESEEVCTCIQCKRNVFTEYDEFGNVIAEKSFDGTKTMTAESYVYSEDGELLLSSTDSSGNTAYYTYNEAGLVETVSAGSSSGTATYDEAGNLLSFSQNVSGLSDGSVMSNSYTYEDDKVKTISHNGFTYEFEYDEQGNLIIAKIGTTILAQNTFNTVDENSLLTGTAFANGQSVSYSYDESGNITAVFYGDTERYSYAYDEEGMLLNVTDNNSGLKTVYTENGVQLVNAEDDFLLFSLAIDDNGNETHNIAGDSVTYLYNTDYNSQTGVYSDTVSFESEKEITEDGIVTSYINQGDVVTNTDWFGRLFSKALSLDIFVDDEEFEANSSFSYNYADTDTTASTKITSIASEITVNEAVINQQEYYEYDSIGNITGIYRLEENEKVYYNRYYYDEANQIVREDNRLGEFSCVYTYDVGGNIVSRIRYPYTEGEFTDLTATETNTYSYNNSVFGDLLTGYNGQSVSYDNMGNITSLDGKEYTWTAGRQLSRMTETENGSYIDYNYDDSGMLNYYAAYDADGNITGACGYCWDDTKLVAMKAIEFTAVDDSVVIEEAFQSRFIYDSDGEALGYLLDDAVPYLYTKNILGDITGVVNGLTGELVVNYIYDAFGNPMLKTPNGTWAEFLNAIIVLISNPLTYRGYLYSFATGYSYYLGSRFYVPGLCRFMNADVYADTAQGVVGTNMFAYCNNNPIMLIDPDGTDAVSNFLEIFSNAINVVLSVLKNILGNGGNSLKNAVNIDMDNLIYATISKAKEIDWFKFKPRISSAINLYTEGELDTKIEICTKTILGKEKVLVSNDNSGQGNNARIEYEVKANSQYYIKVSANNKKTGLYKLILESNYDCMYSPTGGSWIPNNRNYEPYGTLRFEKKVYLTKEETQAYYIMVTRDEFRQLGDDVQAISFDTVMAVLSMINVKWAFFNIAKYIFDYIVAYKIPTLTEMELNEIAIAGNIDSAGNMKNGIVITCVSDINENFLGEKIREYTNYYSSWDGVNIYGEKYYRGKFDVNDRAPL